jgi:hypothetical protein
MPPDLRGLEVWLTTKPLPVRSLLEVTRRLACHSPYSADAEAESESEVAYPKTWSLVASLPSSIFEESGVLLTAQKGHFTGSIGRETRKSSGRNPTNMTIFF